MDSPHPKPDEVGSPRQPAPPAPGRPRPDLDLMGEPMATETYSPLKASTRDHLLHGPRLDLLNNTIVRTSALLPEAGPLSTFIYQNTLVAFEDQPFHVALKRGAQIYGCQPYLSEDEY